MPSFRSRIPLRLLFYPGSQSAPNQVLFQRRHWIYRQQWQRQQNQTRQLTRGEDPESWLSHQDESSVSLVKQCHILFIKWSRISPFMFDKAQYSAQLLHLRLCEWGQMRTLKPTRILESKLGLSCSVSRSSLQEDLRNTVQKNSGSERPLLLMKWNLSLTSRQELHSFLIVAYEQFDVTAC